MAAKRDEGKPTIYWFRNQHEYRNYYFRLGLMRLYDEGEIEYVELPLEEATQFGYTSTVVKHEHRHTSVLVLQADSKRRRVVIDNEDGFIHMTRLIEEVDVYFCCPFAREFHEEKDFIDPLPWQTEEDVREYREKARALIDRFGSHFHKVRRLAPTPTDMALYNAMTPGERRRQIWDYRRRRVSFWKRDRQLWRSDQMAMEARYRQMRAYRECKLRHDIVSRESLWGWPENRIRLHLELQALKEHRAVYTQLGRPPSNVEDRPSLRIRDQYVRHLDILTSPFELEEPYESALASSRLGVFPTGFHWGWRGITFVALCAGIPILMDRPVYEPYFAFDEFDIFYNDGEWGALSSMLNEVTPERWQEIKRKNQSVFDRRLAPDVVARYLVKTASQ